MNFKKNKVNNIIIISMLLIGFNLFDKNMTFNNGIITVKYPDFIISFIHVFKNTNTVEVETNNNINNQESTKTNKEYSTNNNNNNNISNDNISNDLIVDIDVEPNKLNDFFELKYNCNKGGFNYFSYDTIPDPHIDLNRYSPFHYDSQVGEKCNYSTSQINKAKNTSTYKDSKAQYKYDRGHGNHQNIWDHDKNLMKITNYMYNIVPQESTQNRRGLWRHSEIITQCLRQDNQLHVVGGNIWGNDTSNDHFIESHGVVTPDYLFKVIVINNKDVLAFIVPNNPEATPDNSANYMTSVHNIEDKVGYKINIDESLKDIIADNMPQRPKNCSIK